MPVLRDRLPESGKVVIAHPTRQAEALRFAERQGGLDVKLTDLADEGHVYVMDLDLIFAPVEPTLWCGGGFS